MPEQLNFHIITFTDDATPPEVLDMSGYSFKAQIRDRPEYGNLLAEFTIDDSDSENGVIVLRLSPSETSIPPGYWDLQLEDVGGIQTWLGGSVNVDGDITQEV